MDEFAERAIRARGFTLIEVVVAMAVAAILVSIAFSGYSSVVHKTRRAEAVALMVKVAGKQEQFFAEHGVYTSDLTKLGFKTPQGLQTENGYYEVSAVTPTNQTFRLTAKRVQQQTGDTRCGDLTIDHLGVRGAINNEDESPAKNCWE